MTGRSDRGDEAMGPQEERSNEAVGPWMEEEKQYEWKKEERREKKHVYGPA